MAEKVTSMRLNDEDLEQFKAFAKDNGLNQQQAFNSLIALAELEKAKDVLGTRANSIDTFRDTINRALGMYVNALEENTTAEQTIREEFSRELQTKDNTISNLYEQLQEIKDNNNSLEEDLKTVQFNWDISTKQCSELSGNNKNLQSQLDIANRNNNNLQDQVAENNQYKTDYKALEKDLEQLKGDNAALKDTINKLTNDNELLNDKVKNKDDMIEFYKSNNEELKASNKSLEDKYNKQLEEAKAEATKVLDERIKANKQEIINKEIELNNKNDIEVAKKDLEIQKLNNTIEQLKSKDHKPGTVKTNK